MATRRGVVSILVEAKNRAAKVFGQVRKQGDSLTGGLRGGFARAGKGVSSFIFSLKGLAVGLGAIAAIGLGKKLFTLGSAAEETASKFNTVFGPAVAGVNQFLDEFAIKAGLTVEESQNIVSTTGAILQGFGATQKQSALLAAELTRTAGDLASFNNVQGGTVEVSRALQSALAGEREQLKKFGIVIKEKDVDERALLKTGKARASQLTTLERAQASLTLINEKAGVAIGDLDRTSASAANTARRVSARFRQMAEDIGEKVLPIFADLLTALDESAEALNRFSDTIGEAVGRAIAKVQIIFLAATTDFGETAFRVGLLIGNMIALGIVESGKAIDNAVKGVLRKVPGIGDFLASDVGETNVLTNIIKENIATIRKELITLAEAGGFEASREPFAVRRIKASLQALGLLIQDRRRDLQALQGKDIGPITTANRAEQVAFLTKQIKDLEAATTGAAAELARLVLGDDGEDEDRDDTLTVKQKADLEKLKTAGLDAAAAIEMLGLKSALLGPAFDINEEKASILASTIERFTNAGFAATDIVPGFGRSLGQLGFEYQVLSGNIETTERAQKLHTDAVKFAFGIIAAGQTDVEKYSAQIARLTVFFEAGLISQELFAEAMQALSDEFNETADEIEERAKQLAESIAGAVQSGLRDGLVGLGELIGQTLVNLPERAFEREVDAINRALKAGVIEQEEAFVQISAARKKLEEESAKGLSSVGLILRATLGSLMQDVGKTMIAFGTAGVALKSFFANPFAAIAAGVALVALGSALSASVQDSVNAASFSFASGSAGGGGFSAGAGIPPELAAIGAGSVTLIIEGGDLLDLSNPKTERSLAAALEELSGRRVTVIRREG